MSNKNPLPLCIVSDSEIKYVLSFSKGYVVETTRDEYLKLTQILGYERLNVSFSEDHLISTTEKELHRAMTRPQAE